MDVIDDEESRENLEDLEAVEALEKLREEPLEFGRLDDFLEEYLKWPYQDRPLARD